MYAVGTILELKEPRSKPAVEADPAKKVKASKGEVFPYDQVEVIGQSPISYGGGSGWSGVDAQGVILKPLTAFGGNVDKPHGWVIENYNVVSEPDGRPKVGEPDYVKLGPSPEDVFKRAAGSAPKSDTRQRTPHDPFDA